jgi:hypothetical protein
VAEARGRAAQHRAWRAQPAGVRGERRASRRAARHVVHARAFAWAQAAGHRGVCTREGRSGPWLGAKQEGGAVRLNGVQEQGRGEGRRRKEGEKGRKKEKKEREKGKRKEIGGREKTRKEKGEREKGRGASAPIAAVTAVGRPRACVVRTLREKNSIAPALIAESGRA